MGPANRQGGGISKRLRSVVVPVVLLAIVAAACGQNSSRGGPKRASTLPGGKNATNVTDLTFKEQEGSYLVGIAAAMRARTDGSTTVGFLGGQTGPLIGKFQAGYTAGVKSVDPGIKVLVEYIGDTT